MTLAESSTTNEQQTQIGQMIHTESFESLRDLKDRWALATSQEDIYLQWEYLMALESAPPPGMLFRYIIFSVAGKDCGVALFQICHFSLSESLVDSSKLDAETASGLKYKVASQIQGYTMVCGSALLTGEHGYYFDEDQISQRQGAEQIDKSIKALIKSLKKNGIRVSLVLVKDYFLEQKDISEIMKSSNYLEFQVQPTMILHLSPEWDTYESYLAEMSSKYRVKTKKAYGKGAAVTRRRMSLEDIEAYSSEIHSYYLKLLKDVSFNLAKLSDTYFYHCKKMMGERFQMVAYFKDDRLIGFYSYMVFDKKLHAHFIGYEDEMNKEFRLYFNILIDLIKDSIHHACTTLEYSRTAMEIKSSVGAKAYDLNCYLRHRNGLMNRLLKPIVRYYTPEVKWKERHPFKNS